MPRRSRRLVLLLLLVVVLMASPASAALADADAATAVAAALPGAPPACTPSVVAAVAWGAGSGAANVEGATTEDGRTPSIWDAWFARAPARFAGGAGPGGLTPNFRERFREDVALMQRLGLRHFRLSVSWSRLLPGARAGSPVSPSAAKYYNSVVDALNAAGIKTMVVIYHWDLPQSLQEAYGGFLGGDAFVKDYVYFAEQVFRLLAGRGVARWLTFVEPAVICSQGYGGDGSYAPGLSRDPAAMYACGHTLLLAHAAAVDLHRRKGFGGRVSFSTLVTWPVAPPPPQGPQPSPAVAAADAAAAQRKLDAEVGWFLDPVFFGDYPASLRASKGSLLKPFTPEQQRLLVGSLDFIAANCFTAKYVWARRSSSGDGGLDPSAAGSGWSEGRAPPGGGAAIGEQTGVPWMLAVPSSQREFLRYLTKRYTSPAAAAAAAAQRRSGGGGATAAAVADARPVVVITASGTQVPGEDALPAATALDDAGFRVAKYYAPYLSGACEAVAAGEVRLAAWFAWSFLDSWEWTDGLTRKFGLVRVDYGGGKDGKNGSKAGATLARTPKASALWLSEQFFTRGAR